MNAIDRIKNRFEIKLPDKPEVELSQPAPPPCQCGHDQHWRAHHQAQWRCQRCTPPPTRSLVAEWWPVEPATTGEPNTAPLRPEPVKMVDESHVTFCRPWCECCGGWRGIERTYSDGSHTIHCLTCKADLPEVPRERPKKQKSTVEAA
jgi:hypothetical protein